MPDANGQSISSPRKINLWLIAFVIALIAFEGARETAVIAMADAEAPPRIAVRKMIIATDDEIYAEGRWRRTDGGDPIYPSVTTVDCYREGGFCRVAEVVVPGDRVSPPIVTNYPARFDGGRVQYEMGAGCVRYAVTIDAAAQVGLSIRTKLPPEEQTPVIDCDYAEDRIEMSLEDGYGAAFNDGFDAGLPDGRFLPIARLARWIVNL